MFLDLVNIFLFYQRNCTVCTNNTNWISFIRWYLWANLQLQ